MVASQNASPSAFFTNNSPSPNGGLGFVNASMLAGSEQHHWPQTFDYGGGSSNSHGKNGFTSPPIMNNPSPLSSGMSLPDTFARPRLTIHPTPQKSRVETQIPIKLTLSHLPPGITKLHLPTHTISKPKLLSKPAAERSPDTLELYTTLVCTSAMQNPDFCRRAFTRAATSPQSPLDSLSVGTGSSDGTSDEEDENKPLNGGEVKICQGCITRERKRAARKKVKKVEEEESWHKDETKRVIVFNTHEVKEWQTPSAPAQAEATDPMVPEGAMQVDAPMRIACYCRHQSEKLGFQVIFTIKDCNDRLVAQAMTSSIMITDDHKTHNVPPLSTQTSNGSDGQLFTGSTGIFPSGPSFEMPPLDAFRNSYSSSDLNSLQRAVPQMYPPSSGGNSSHPSQATSTTMTPRNLSRQASPSISGGPYAKKRKASASGSSKVPSGLAMTRLETAQPSVGQNAQNGSTTATATAATTPSPFTPTLGAFPSQHEIHFGQHAQTSQSIGPPYNTGPPTPNSHENPFTFAASRNRSMENLAMQQMYSAPPSAHPSRAPSPTGLRNNSQSYQPHHAQLAQAIANGFYAVPATQMPQRLPTIHKIIPSEGPKAGGIEVTCLGSGFFQGLEVMFGDTKATTTTYWGETSLVCLLPPALLAGRVPVTFKQQQMQPYPTPPLPKQQVFFNYVDDDEQQIIRTCLAVLSHKMNGNTEDVRELARRIIGDGSSSSSWGASTGHSPPGGAQHQQRSDFNGATFGIDVEATLLKCLDLIDLDDSPRMPRLNLRRKSGQTMLHLACSLGFHRFVAALLARGANPDPRDSGGFTPMHFAAMHNHPQIVRRLMLCGADPLIRSLQGYTPSEVSSTEEVFHATRQMEHHRRNRSGGSLRSRTSSATSLRSLWEAPSLTRISTGLAGQNSDSDDGSQDDDEDEYDQEDDNEIWMRSRSRRPSAQHVTLKPADPPSTIQLPAVAGGMASTAAAMTAFRDQLTAQIQHIQQTMHLNLPNLPQMPTLPVMNLPDYQAYLPTTPMVRRISSLVPNMSTSRPGSADHPTKEADSRWWDLFSGTVPSAPPAYDEIFPQNDMDTKRASAAQAAADIVADNKCMSLFDNLEASGSSTISKSSLLDTLRIGNDHLITREQQDLLRLAHTEKVKRLRSDRNLFFVWVSFDSTYINHVRVTNKVQIPLLIVILVAMLYNNLPQTWYEATRFIGSFGALTRDRIAEVEHVIDV
jgi:hypothetical protein